MTIREFCLEYGDGDPETWWREEWLVIHDPEPLQQRLNELGTGIKIEIYQSPLAEELSALSRNARLSANTGGAIWRL